MQNMQLYLKISLLKETGGECNFTTGTTNMHADDEGAHCTQLKLFLIEYTRS